MLSSACLNYVLSLFAAINGGLSVYLILASPAQKHCILLAVSALLESAVNSKHPDDDDFVVIQAVLGQRGMYSLPILKKWILASRKLTCNFSCFGKVRLLALQIAGGLLGVGLLALCCSLNIILLALLYSTK